MPWRRRNRGGWDDPDDLTLEDIVEDHDAELGEHDRAISEHDEAINKHDEEIGDLKDRMDVSEAAQAALIDDAAERARRERDHVVAYTQKVRDGAAAGKGPYRCSNCNEYGHNRRGCPDLESV